MGRRLTIGALLAISLARCLFPSLDELSGGTDASQTDVSEASNAEGGPIAYVQQSTTSPFPPATVTMPGAIGNGDTLVVCGAFPADFGSLQVSDTLGRTYVLLGSQDSIGTKTGRNVCFVSIGGPGGNDTISLTTTNTTLADGAAHDLEAYVFEYQNISALDQKMTNVGTIEAGSGTDAAWDGGSITATSANELLWAWVEGNSTANLAPSFTSRTTFHSNNVGDELLDAAGTFPITGTANANWTLVAATFKGF